jgi:hypothetical protein
MLNLVGEPKELVKVLDNMLREPSLFAIKENGESCLAGQEAAINYCLVVGACRLFGIEPAEHGRPELDGTVPARVARAAITYAHNCILKRIEDARNLRWKIQAAEDPDIQAVMKFHELEFATEVLGLFSAVTEAYLANPEFPGLEKALADMSVDIHKYLCLVDDYHKLLAEGAKHPWFDELRKRFTSEPRPWWLKGEHN